MCWGFGAPLGFVPFFPLRICPPPLPGLLRGSQRWGMGMAWNVPGRHGGTGNLRPRGGTLGPEKITSEILEAGLWAWCPGPNTARSLWALLERNSPFEEGLYFAFNALK